MERMCDAFFVAHVTLYARGDLAASLRYTHGMPMQQRFGCAWVLALALCAGACKDKDDKGAAGGKTTAADLDRRCEELSMACGEKDKHVEKVLDGCKAAAKKQVEKGCIFQTIVAYDCYQKEVCGKNDKVWAIEDLAVLAERHKKCETERLAARACMDKK